MNWLVGCFCLVRLNMKKNNLSFDFMLFFWPCFLRTLVFLYAERLKLACGDKSGLCLVFYLEI
jgi:hypothetical protein